MTSAILRTIDDPRTPLDKARRGELIKFALANGVREIHVGATTLPVNDGTAAELLRRELRSRGLTNIPIPHRTLGQPDPSPRLRASNGSPLTVAQQTPQPKVNEVNALDDFARQAVAQQAMPPNDPPEYGAMTRAELAKTCKARGIGFGRTAKKEELVEKLRGKDAA